MERPSTSTGVLLLAYGGPRNEAELEPFLVAVTGGRELPPQVVAEIRKRYWFIGGHSPLPGIAAELATLLERRLREAGDYVVRLGMMFSPPTMGEAIKALSDLKVERAVAVVSVPQYSQATIGRYERCLEADLDAAGRPFVPVVVRSWATQRHLVRGLTEKVKAALASLTEDERREVTVVFTAHSVPRSTVPEGDPFEAELTATAAAVAAEVGLSEWRLAYQSAGRGGGGWIGPMVADVLAEEAASGRRIVMVVPIHFLIDNVEILYDLDIALRQKAEALGVRLLRSESLNTSPFLVDALAEVVREAAGEK